MWHLPISNISTLILCSSTVWNIQMAEFSHQCGHYTIVLCTQKLLKNSECSLCVIIYWIADDRFKPSCLAFWPLLSCLICKKADFWVSFKISQLPMLWVSRLCWPSTHVTYGLQVGKPKALSQQDLKIDIVHKLKMLCVKWRTHRWCSSSRLSK